MANNAPKAAAARVEDMAAQPSVLESLVGYNLKRVYILMDSDFRRTFEGDDMPPRVFSTLAIISESPGVMQSEVARMLGIERSGLVAIVDGLEKRGLVERKPFPGDRRVHALHPTKAGRETFNRGINAVTAHEDSALSMLSSGERKKLLTLLQKIRAGFLESEK
ncbi:MAG: MarR family winged helix-turn-helix transcriptional regulator [Rhodobacteraceae bacterium]|nr:MarR family winged helix-turn-helix transcriptional regulator [Paracoccaceae bacterium]